MLFFRPSRQRDRYRDPKKMRDDFDYDSDADIDAEHTRKT